ncbi:MAG: hypothetical protein GY869_27310 [Planctomycetes bacterium]|nr:hypothetical protein [Planctomycetota bacterium]
MTSPRYIEHIIEPDKLLLSWQPARDSGKSRMRRFVAELTRSGANIQLEYLRDSEDFVEARKAGFEHYFGFSIEDKLVHQNVLPAFMRRLPPRKRNDFGRFLTAIRINPTDIDKMSDFALLAYAGAILPGDGFSIVNPFSNAEPPFELMLEIQGYRHYLDNVPYDTVNHQMQVTFQPEPENEKDPDAIIALINSKQAGYVCRGLNKSFHNWLAKGYNIQATIERINGAEDSPRIYALVKVTFSV